MVAQNRLMMYIKSIINTSVNFITIHYMLYALRATSELYDLRASSELHDLRASSELYNLRAKSELYVMQLLVS